MADLESYLKPHGAIPGLTDTSGGQGLTDEDYKRIAAHLYLHILTQQINRGTFLIMTPEEITAALANLIAKMKAGAAGPLFGTEAALLRGAGSELECALAKLLQQPSAAFKLQTGQLARAWASKALWSLSALEAKISSRHWQDSGFVKPYENRRQPLIDRPVPFHFSELRPFSEVERDDLAPSPVPFSTVSLLSDPQDVSIYPVLRHVIEAFDLPPASSHEPVPSQRFEMVVRVEPEMPPEISCSLRAESTLQNIVVINGDPVTRSFAARVCLTGQVADLSRIEVSGNLPQVYHQEQNLEEFVKAIVITYIVTLVAYQAPSRLSTSSTGRNYKIDRPQSRGLIDPEGRESKWFQDQTAEYGSF